jgi:hypothetical protein
MRIPDLVIQSVNLLRHYWNRSDLLEQLHKVSMILSQSAVDRHSG